MLPRSGNRSTHYACTGCAPMESRVRHHSIVAACHVLALAGTTSGATGAVMLVA